MTVRVTTDGRTKVVGFATATATTLLLYTALASPGQQPCQRVDSGIRGHESMLTMNTVNQPETEYVVDGNVVNYKKFHQLANEWKREQGARSTVAALATLPSYQKIIGMGKDALPLILSELKSEGANPDHWFWALAAISDENPVPAESRGNLLAMANAWLGWGQENGYV